MEKQQEKRIYTFPQDETRPVPVRHKPPIQSDWFNVASRGIGLLLLLFGLWASVHVFLQAVQLYRAPTQITQLAIAIEQGSNLDSSLAPRGEDFDQVSAGAARKGDLHLSYFVGWIIALMLLMLMSMIAFSAMRTGGELVFQDKQKQQLIQLMAKTFMNKDKSSN